MRVPVYQHKAALPGRAAAVAGSAAGFGDGFARLAGELQGMAVARMAAAREQEERAAAVAAARLLAETRGDWRLRLRDEGGAPEDRAADFTRRLLQDYDADVAKRLAAAPEALRPKLESGLAVFRDTVTEKSLAIEAGARLQKRTEDLRDALGLGIAAVREDAGEFESIRDDGLAAIDAAGLAPAAAAELAAEHRRRLAAAAIGGLVAQAPERVEAALSRSDLGRLLPPGERDALAGAAAAERRRREAEAGTETALREVVLASAARRRVEAALASAAREGRAEPLAPQEIEAAFPGEADRVIRAMAEAQGLHVARRQVAFSTPGDDAAALERWRQGIGDHLLPRAIEEKRRRLADDPAAYVLEFSPGLARQAEQARAAGDGAAEQAAIAAVDFAQQRLGLVPQDCRLLPRRQAAALAAELETAAPGELPARLQAAAERFGGHWPRVRAELTRAGLSPHGQVLAALDRPEHALPRAAFSEALRRGRKDLADSLGPEQAAAVRAAVAQGVNEAAGAEAPGLAPSLELLAMLYATGGRPPEQAARLAVAPFRGEDQGQGSGQRRPPGPQKDG